jgi:hypothetical protein
MPVKLPLKCLQKCQQKKTAKATVIDIWHGFLGWNDTNALKMPLKCLQNARKMPTELPALAALALLALAIL